MAEQALGLGDRGLEHGDRVPRRLRAVGVACEAELGRVVDDAGDPPGAACLCLELGEVGLPDAVSPSGRGIEGRASGLRERSSLGLVVDRHEQATPGEGTFDRGLRDDRPVGAQHRPDLAVAPC